MEELQNYFTKGNDDQPINMTDAYNLLVNYKMTQSKTEMILVYHLEEVPFTNVIGN